MEDTMEHFVHMPRSSKVDSSSQQCFKIQKNLSEDVSDARSMETSMLGMQCHSWTTSKWSRLTYGDWLHGTIPKVWRYKIHFVGDGLCVQVGRSIAMLDHRLQALQKDVPSSDIPMVWNTPNGHKWQRVTHHRQDLLVVPSRIWSQAQCCNSIPSPNKWSSWNIK